MRGEALRQLKEILLRYPPNTLHSQLSSLLRGVAALSLDKEKDIRRDSLIALNLILSPISKAQLVPFHEILISYLSCAMTHINSHVKEDSLLFLDVLIQNCGNVLAKNSHKILPNFLGMICSLQGEVKLNRLLKTTLKSKSTSVKWRIKVLERLANIFTSVIYYEKLRMNTIPTKTIEVREHTEYIPVYGDSSIRDCEVDLDKDLSSTTSCTKETIFIEEFVKYVGLLMPLMFDIWLEVCPDEKMENYTEVTNFGEVTALLKNIVEIIQSITEYIDMLKYNVYDAEYTRVKHWFKDTFHNLYMKNFLSRFPYEKAKQVINESRKRQEDFSQLKFTEECLEQNLGLCQIHVYFTSLINRNQQLPKVTKNYCISIVKYLNGKLILYIIIFALSFFFLRHINI